MDFRFDDDQELLQQTVRDYLEGEVTPEAVRALGRPVIAFSEAMRAQIAAIRVFLMKRMYRHWRVARMR